MSYRPPTLGRKEVDLYRLFREVTAYGGCDSVVSKEGTWAKIYRGLDNFSPTETSASFRLKKMYTKYLLAYEKHVFNFLPIPQKKHRYTHNAASTAGAQPATATTGSLTGGIQNSAIFPPTYSYQSSEDLTSKRVKTFSASENLSMYQSHGVHQSTLLNSTKYKPGAGLGLNGGSWQRDPPRAPMTRAAASKRAAESPRPRATGMPEDHEVGGHRLRGSISPTLGAQVPRSRAMRQPASSPSITQKTQVK